MAKNKKKLKPYKDEALLVAHLLGGRYGFESGPEKDTRAMPERVAEAIQVAREIRNQLAALEPPPPPPRRQEIVYGKT